MALRLDFLRDVLGAEGAKALSKAVDREPSLGGALELRAIIGWVSCLDDYKGSIPSTQCQLHLNKSEDTYTGCVGDYPFRGESLYHVSAAVANALELEPGKLDPELRGVILTRLGKSLDLLVKSQLSKKVLDANSGYQITHEHHDLGDGEMLTQINAHLGGKRVGWALMTHQGANLHPDDVNVDPEHRRQGLASAMYAHAERVTGKKVIPSQQQQAPGKLCGRATPPSSNSA
jgi:predicted GNAT family acetyltransferase